jgi:hypothetical protein
MAYVGVVRNRDNISEMLSSLQATLSKYMTSPAESRKAKTLIRGILTYSYRLSYGIQLGASSSGQISH